MRSPSQRYVEVFFLTIVFLLIAPKAAIADSITKKFIVAQSMHYKGGVNLLPFGVPSNPIVYESSLLPSKSLDDLIDNAGLVKLAAGLQKGNLPTVLDIERWPIDSEDATKRSINREKLLSLLKELRNLRPDIKFGFYGVLPSRTYWPLVDSAQNKKRGSWERLNAMAKEDFAPYVDAIYPSLYTFYADEKGWRSYAETTLKEARKFNKPVYCYLWPKYHTGGSDVGGEYIPREYWRLQLETCYRHADGIVIWNFEPDSPWNSDAPWWLETLRFLQDHSLVSIR